MSGPYIRKENAFIFRDDGELDEDLFDVIKDEQAGNSPHTAGTVCARAIMEINGAMASQR